MKVYIETYGCTANEADSAAMREAILAAGGAVVASPAEADTVVVNTCAVTEHTARQMLRAIGRHAGRHVVVAGCLAAAQPGLLRGCERADAPGALPLLRVLGLDASDRIEVGYSASAVSGGTAIVKIAEGCCGHCTYCIVRRARGALRSRPPGEIVAAVRRAVAAGAAEVFLTAQDAGAYGLDAVGLNAYGVDTRGVDNGCRLPQLIERVDDIGGDFRVRVGMMNPFSIADIVPQLAAALRLPRVYRFAHIPVQSGSDRILRLMGRPYTEGEYSGLVARLREGVPGLTLSTDYIAGFPTESDADFRLTLDDLRRNRPLKVNITRFSPRPGTPAAEMPDLPGTVKKVRSRALTALHHEITSAFMRAAAGGVRPAFVAEKGKRRGTVVARDGSYNMIVIGEDLPLGTPVEVEITGARTTYMIGRRLP